MDEDFDDVSTFAPTLPDWDAEQERYIAAVRRGRHPTSFKRNSELWYYVQETSSRVNRIAKGHTLARILQEKDESFYGGDGDSINDNWTLDDSSVEGNGRQAGDNDDFSINSIESSQQMTSPGSASMMSPMSVSGSRNKQSRGKSRGSTGQSTRSTGNLIHDVMLGVNIMSPKRLANLKLDPVSSPTPLPDLDQTGNPINEGNKSSERELIDFSLNGVHIDVRKNTALNYGNLVVVMNGANDVLCLDRHNHMRIKSKKQLLLTDKMCFKLVDLREYHNPGEITMGQPFWLQLVETPVDGAPTLNFFQSKVLGSKIFSLETISTQQLDPTWGKNEKRAEIFKREKEVDSDEEYDKRELLEEVKAAELKASAEAAQAAKQSTKGGKKRGWGTVRTKKTGINIMVQLQKKAAEKKKREDELRLRREEEEAEEHGLDQHRDDHQVGDVSGATAPVHLALNCHMYDDGPPEPGATEIVSREAINLGCWIAETAENKDYILRDEEDGPLPGLGDPLKSNTPLIMTQDLYCLADSKGSKYLPWPLHSNDYDDQDMLSMRIKKKKNFKARQIEKESMGTVAGGKGQEKKGKALRGVFASTLNEPHFGVIRHIVKQRREDSPFIIDPKCVWRLGAIEALQDVSSLTQAELHTAKVMKKAKEILRDSEMHRHGERRYHGSHTHPDEEGYVPPSTIKARRDAKIAEKERIAAEAVAMEEKRLTDEARLAFGRPGQDVVEEEERKKKEKEEKEKRDKETEDQINSLSPERDLAGLESLMSAIPKHNIKKDEGNDDDARPKIPGGSKFSLMLRKNTAHHLRKREDQLLESRRFKEEPDVSREYFKNHLIDWDRSDEKFPDDAMSLASQLSFDYVPPRKRSPGKDGEGGSQGGGSPTDSPEKDGTAGRILLSMNHRTLYEDGQKKTLKLKTLGLRRAHYQNYPNFHKDPQWKEVDTRSGQLRDPTPLEDYNRIDGRNYAFNDPFLSPGEKVLSLRQAFDHLETGSMDVRTANNGLDHSEIDPRYTTVARTPATPGSGLVASRKSAKKEEGNEDKDEQMARREFEEAQRAARVAAKMAVLQQEDETIVAALQHRRRDASEKELKRMAENWHDDILKYEEEKKTHAGLQ
jgi:hypothetical protein